MPKKNELLSFDILLVILVFFVIGIGIVIIGSATRINVYSTSSEYESQQLWFALGIILMLAAAFIDYHLMSKFYLVIYFFNLFLLIIVLFLGSGDEVSRWIFGIQPSEFSKIFMIIFLATYIDKNKEKINTFPVIAISALATAIPTILIKLQPSLSASLVTIVIYAVILFVGNIDIKYVGIVLLIVGISVAIFYFDVMSEDHFLLSKILDEYQIKRIVSSINLDLTGTDPDYYQTRNSIWAIGSGQLTGKGLYNGMINQLSYLPESHNDFIFSVIGEEFGFVGCIGVIILMFLIIIRCVLIAIKACDNLGTLIVSGVVGMFAFQTFGNIGVATGLLPNTGIPLPFISYGGSSMWINMIAIGLVLNVGMKKPKSIFKG
ncbi:MAG: rod shape-determining protein RodA [Firmicutes bacterium]|nr:rod shape-determining protein RodA [Bacillota bacterium]